VLLPPDPPLKPGSHVRVCARAENPASSATAAAAAIVLTKLAKGADENSEMIEVFCCVIDFMVFVCLWFG
jgi:hypothetical protein